MKSLAFLLRKRAPVRLCASALAVAAAFPVLAQSQAAGTLGEVVVTATRFAEPANSLPIGVSVITKEDIERAGITTVNEAVMKLLGVPGRVDLYGGGEYSLDLRGFGEAASSNQVVVVDGIKITEADLGGSRLAGIAIHTVERIEVLRGSGSVMYGTGATGGVILITTKAGLGTSRMTSANVYAATGSNGLGEARATVTVASGGFSLDVAGHKRKSDNHRDYFKSDVAGTTIQAQWSNDWLRLGASHAGDSLLGGLPGALTAAQFEANPHQSDPANANNQTDIRNVRDTVFAEAELGSWQLGLNAGQRTKKLDSLDKGMRYSYDIDASNLVIRARHESQIGKARNALTLGQDMADWKRVNPWAVSQQRSDAMYLQDDMTYANGTRLYVGFRMDEIKQVDSTTGSTDQTPTAWEMGVTQPLSDTRSIYGRFGKSYRLANVDEIGFTTPGTVLQPQDSRDVEVGYRWNHADGGGELRYYRNRIKHEIGYDPTAAGPYPGSGANINYEATVRQGLELEIRKEFNSSLGIQANFVARESKFTQGHHDGKDIPLVAGATFALRTNWKPAPSHSVDAGVQWVSSQSVDFENTCKVPSYSTVDARYAYARGQVELSLGISNLLDSKYFTQAFGCSGGVTNGIYPEAGRAFTAALRVNF